MVADIERAGVDEVMLVAHSMGGVTVPGVAAVLGADRVSRMVFVAAAMPPNGMSILQDLVGDLQQEVSDKVEEDAEPAPFPEKGHPMRIVLGLAAGGASDPPRR